MNEQIDPGSYLRHVCSGASGAFACKLEPLFQDSQVLRLCLWLPKFVANEHLYLTASIHSLVCHLEVLTLFVSWKC